MPFAVDLDGERACQTNRRPRPFARCTITKEERPFHAPPLRPSRINCSDGPRHLRARLGLSLRVDLRQRLLCRWRVRHHAHGAFFLHREEPRAHWRDHGFVGLQQLSTSAIRDEFRAVAEHAPVPERSAASGRVGRGCGRVLGQVFLPQLQRLRQPSDWGD